MPQPQYATPVSETDWFWSAQQEAQRQQYRGLTKDRVIDYQNITPVDPQLLEYENTLNGVPGIDSPKIDASVAIKSGSVGQEQIDPNVDLGGVAGWSSDLGFSKLDSNTVQWAAGAIYLDDGTTYSIEAGNTGDMTVLTYIYLDPVVSITEFQITTSALDAAGEDKILVAVAKNGTPDPFYQVFGGGGGIFIGNEQVGDGAINTSNIVDTAIIESKLADLAVTNAKVADLAISTGKIQLLAITETLIADNSISTAKIQANAVTANEILAGTITSNKIAANTIVAGNIAAGTITASEIAAETITGAQIAALTISGDKIIANTITGAKIAANTITASLIAANTITANEIAANTITANEIASGTITTSQLNFTPVETSSVIASINSSVEGIRISATKIHITGDVTFASNWTSAANSNPLGWTDDTAANSAQSTANSAYSLAQEKIKTYYQTSSPSSGIVTGDIWYDTDDGYKMYRYNGTSWQAVYETLINGSRIITNTIAASSIQAGEITGWTITGSLIRTSSGSTRVQMNNSTNCIEVYISGSLYGYFGATGYTDGSILRISDAYSGTGYSSVWFENSGTANTVWIKNTNNSAANRALAITHTGNYGTALYVSGYNEGILIDSNGIALSVTTGRVVISNSSKFKLPVGTNLY